MYMDLHCIYLVVTKVEIEGDPSTYRVLVVVTNIVTLSKVSLGTRVMLVKLLLI